MIGSPVPFCSSSQIAQRKNKRTKRLENIEDLIDCPKKRQCTKTTKRQQLDILGSALQHGIPLGVGLVPVVQQHLDVDHDGGILDMGPSTSHHHGVQQPEELVVAGGQGVFTSDDRVMDPDYYTAGAIYGFSHNPFDEPFEDIDALYDRCVLCL